MNDLRTIIACCEPMDLKYAGNCSSYFGRIDQGVSIVIPQTTHDYVSNLETLRPAYVVHGSDWTSGTQSKVRQRVLDTLSKWGGELVEPEYTGGISTTQIIQKCKREE